MEESLLIMKKFTCIPVAQADYKMIMFAIDAKELESLVEVNRRPEGKKEGYQRVLVPGRTTAIAKFIDSGNAIPTNIVIALDSDKVKLAADQKSVQISTTGDAGWVIDGQHR